MQYRYSASTGPVCLDMPADISFCRAEMTDTMQQTLRTLSVREVQSNFRVTRSDEIGSKGLYALTMPAVASRERPASLQLAPSKNFFGSLMTPKSSATSKGFFGFVSHGQPSILLES